MTKLVVLLLLCSCVVSHKVKNVPTTFKVETEGEVDVGPNFDTILEYCTGRIDHEIEAELRNDPDFFVNEEDRQFEIDECYYKFDFGSINIPTP